MMDWEIERDKWPDDVRRIFDVMNMHATAHAYGYVPISMADGKPLDNNAYPTWTLAVRAAKWDRDNYMFLEIQPDGITYKVADACLRYARTLSKLGFRIPNPEWDAGPLVASVPEQRHDKVRMIRQLISGKPLYPEGSTNLPQRDLNGIPPAFRSPQRKVNP